MGWNVKTFEELTNTELHDIYQIRINVFVVEQNCPYSEIDGKDAHSVHLFKKDGEEIVAYARLLPPGVSYEQASIGRVLVNQHYRRNHFGYELMEKAIHIIQQEWQEPTIKIQAQSYLRSFYGSFGFMPVSEEYLEDGIPHVDMMLKTEEKTS